MQISGLFTLDEIHSATQQGAQVENLRGGLKAIVFEDDQQYQQWLDEQKTNHPDRWSHLISLMPKD